MSESTDILLRTRREIAQRVSEAFSSLPEVVCIFVHGSTATGSVDAQSDIDLTCVCADHILGLDERRSILSQLGVGWTLQDASLDNPIWAAYDSDGRIDAVLVSIHYQTASFIAHIIDQVIHHGVLATEEVPFRPYTLIGLLRQAWLLSDRHGLFRQWLAQTEEYPKKLQANILGHFVPLLRAHVTELVSTAERALGPRLFIFFLDRAIDAMTSILYALNERFDPADKRAEQTILPHLANLPSAFISQWNAVLEGPFDRSGMVERAHIFEHLTNEVLSAAAQHME